MADPPYALTHRGVMRKAALDIGPPNPPYALLILLLRGADYGSFGSFEWFFKKEKVSSINSFLCECMWTT